MCRTVNVGLRLCVQYATGMAAASQTIIVRTALSYQDIYEVNAFMIFNLIFEYNITCGY